MSSHAEQRRLKVTPWDDRAFGLLTGDDEIVLEIGKPDGIKPADFRARIEKLQSTGVRISVIRLEFAGFREYLDSGFDIFPKTDYDVAITATGTAAEYMSLLERLRNNNRRYVLPLHNDADRKAIKILNSAGLKVLVDLRDPALDWAMMDDLITDQLLATVKRPQLDPVTMMSLTLHSEDKDLSSVYFRNPGHFTVYDPKSGSFGGPDGASQYAFVSAKMAEAGTCARCEGFRSCKSFLEPYIAGNYDKCRGFYREFLDTYEVLKIKEETKQKTEKGQ